MKSKENFPNKLDLDRSGSVNMGGVIKHCYKIYGVSVTISRAIPNVFDGFKPIHKRIVYTMHTCGYKGHFAKCVAVCADVLKYYHPHGDAATYQSLVSLAQEFNNRISVIDTQGNFGSTDKDPAAAARYTACRAKDWMSMIYTADLKYDTVPMIINEMGNKEPVFLPVRLPMILINGSSGIAVGYATQIPMHNPAEITEYVIDYLEYGDSLDPINYILGPDFSTGGQALIESYDEYREILNTGRGRVKVYAEYTIEEEKDFDVVRITSLPPKIGNSELSLQIYQLYKAGNLPDLKDIIDLTSRDNINICIHVTRGSGHRLMARLYRDTEASCYIYYNMVCLVDGRPQICSVKDIAKHFWKERKRICIARLQCMIAEMGSQMRDLRCHILVSMNASAIVKVIRQSNEPELELTAIDLKLTKQMALDLDIRKDVLEENLRFTAKEARQIMSMSLQRLTKVRTEEALAKYLSLKQDRLDKLNLLKNEVAFKQSMIQEIREVLNALGDGILTRRTKIIKNFEDRSAPSLHVLTNVGTMHMIDYNELQNVRRGSVGRNFFDMSISRISWMGCLKSEYVGILTTLGDYVRLPIDKLRSRSDVNLYEITSLSPSDAPSCAFPIMEEGLLLMYTKHGQCKVVDYSCIKSRRRRLFKTKYGDEIVGCMNVSRDDVVVVYSGIKACRIRIQDIRISNPGSGGIALMRLSGKDELVSVRKSDTSIIIYQDGYVRADRADNYPILRRGCAGVRASFNLSTHLIAILDQGEVILYNSSGKWLRTDLSQEKITSSRRARGVKLQSLGEATILGACIIRK